MPNDNVKKVKKFKTAKDHPDIAQMPVEGVIIGEIGDFFVLHNGLVVPKVSEEV